MTSNIELDVVGFLQALIRAKGIDGELSEVASVAVRWMRQLGFDEVWQDEAGNVIGKRVGSRPGPRLVFDAHMDTVEEGDLDAWQHDPFCGELSEGKIWGRGAIDDKGSLAAFSVALASLPREEIAGELYAVGTVGEERMEGGALSFLLDAIKPDGVIIGEPTDLRLGIGHKGRTRLVFFLQGKAAHSSSPHVGDNAIDKAVELVRRVRAIPPVKDALLGESVMEPIEIISTPYPSASTIPYACQVVFDRRMVQGETRQSVLALHQDVLKGMNGSSMEFPKVELISYTGKDVGGEDFHPAWSVDPQSKWVKLSVQGLQSAGIDPEIYGTPYCTNGSSSAGERGIPTIVFGPGNVHLAHATDEFADVAELVSSVHGYIGMAKALGKFRP